MVRNILKKFADPQEDNSLTYKLRLRRISLLKRLISPLPKPLKILDVGGTLVFWEKMKFLEEKNIEITLLNLSKTETPYQNFKSLIGDGRNMSEFRDSEFDLVFSNSVIEHVGNYNDQKIMAKEVQRVGKRYFLQTPNYYFPIEPHFLFPFFQFLPSIFKTFLLHHFNLGWYSKRSDREQAKKVVESIRLLKKKELEELFPGATIYKEKFWRITISFIVYKGL